MSLYCEVLGAGDPIVLIHGWGFNSSIMRPLAESLAANYAVTLIDLPGFGNSQNSIAVSLDEWLALLIACIPPRAVILGWSLGGLLALKLAQALKDCAGLMLLASSPCFVRDVGWPALDLAELMQFKSYLKTDSANALRRFAYWQSGGRGFYRALLAYLDQRASYETLFAGLTILESTDLRALCSDLRVPIQCVLGASDVVVPAMLSHALEDLMPQAKVRVIESCHAGCVLKTEALVPIIREFIDVKRKVSSSILL